MTIQEMHDLWDVIRDFYKAPYYESDEKDFFINSAIHAFVVSSIPNANGGRVRIEDQRLLDQISTLITSTKKSGVDFDISSAVKNVIDLASCSIVKPTDFWFFLSVIANIGTKRPEVNVVSFDELTSIATDAFNGVSNDVVRVSFLEGKIYFISESVPDSVILYYVKSPAKVSLTGLVNCNLPESVHDRIVHMAVQISTPGSNLMEMYKAQENEINKR